MAYMDPTAENIIIGNEYFLVLDALADHFFTLDELEEYARTGGVQELTDDVCLSVVPNGDDPENPNFYLMDYGHGEPVVVASNGQHVTIVDADPYNTATIATDDGTEITLDWGTLLGCLS